MAADPRTARRTRWSVVLIALVVLVAGGLALAGLAAAAYIVLMVVAVGSYGSNK